MFATVSLVAEDLPKLSFRGSLGSFWNEGWGEKFYFKTISQINPGLDTITVNFNRTLRHDLLAPEIWYNIMLSNEFVFSLCARYENLKIDIEDDLPCSWMIYDKSLSADLNFYGIGGRLQWLKHIHTKPYIGISIGYCHGNLKTYQDIEFPDGSQTTVNVSGDGGGLFYDLVAGANIPVLFRSSLFVECDIRFTPGWKRFGTDSVDSIGLDERSEWLLTEDRKLDRFVGWILRVGIQIDV
jgi:hypothetical protein